MIVLMKIKSVTTDVGHVVKRYELEQDTFPEVGYFSLTPKDKEFMEQLAREQSSANARKDRA